MLNSLLNIDSSILNTEKPENKKKNKLLIDKHFSPSWVNMYFKK